MSVSYPSDSRPQIQMRHIDGPVLWLRDGRAHWLTILERIAVRFGWHDAYSLERKHWGGQAMSIILPPLPNNLVGMSHGPFKPSLYDEGEDYCVRCYTRSIYLASRQCNPHIDADSLRARDIEVARLVLKAAADLVDDNAAYCSGQTASILGSNADAIRALGVRHHE